MAVLGNGADAPGPRSWRAYDGQYGRDLAVAIRAACGCGWRGERIHPIDWREPEISEGEESRTGPYAEWQGHIAFLLRGTLPADVVELVRTLGERLGELAPTRSLGVLKAVGRLEGLAAEHGPAAAAAARRHEASWGEIGRALGISKQAAWQRLAKHVPAADQEETAPAE